MQLEGKRIVITGGTGSLGQALTRRLLTGEMGKPAKVIIFSRDEAKQHALRLSYLQRANATDEIIYDSSRGILTFMIGDIRDYASVQRAIGNVDVIFNAAALKQVPTCEYFPFEAVQTNIVGAQNLVRAIRENGRCAELVVGISTDKACKPVNVMGMTKALQERIFVNANRGQGHTNYLCVRYGNVIASRGSVIPLFQEQIAKGGPVTITTKEMTRFLLTLDQAVDTIFAAVRGGGRGETYIPRAPAARVVDIADVMIDNRNIRVEFTGIRPGEKTHEILVSEEELSRTTERDGYYVIHPIVPELRTETVDIPALTAEYSSREITLDRPALSKLLASAEYAHAVA
jgi:UDP-glucose 4-epimerase